MYYHYTSTEIDYLKKKDKKLGQVIEQLGHLQRPVHPDLFSSLVHHIVGQQISAKAVTTIWNRMLDTLGQITYTSILSLTIEELQAFGITFKKANYIHSLALKVQNEELNLDAIYTMSDEEAIQTLIQLDGIGVWTAEMILLFTLMRQNIFSYGDIAIHRGLRIIYHHKKIDKKLFEKYRKRYSPYGSVASIYLWAVAGGALDKEVL